MTALRPSTVLIEVRVALADLAGLGVELHEVNGFRAPAGALHAQRPGAGVEVQDAGTGHDVEGVQPGKECFLDPVRGGPGQGTRAR